jgi:hypothetical protein
MMVWRYLRVTVFLVAALALPARGQVTWSEFGNGGADSGELPSTGYDLSSLGLSAIVGELSFSGDVDMYKIRILQPADFSVTTGIDPGTHEDSRLFLFDADSVGIAYNDDAQSDTLDHSELPADSLGLTESGFYYLAVSMYEVIALDASGNQIFEDPRDFGPQWKRINRAVTTAPLAAWFLRGDGGKPFGTYRITLTGTAAPTGVEQDVPSGFRVSNVFPNPFVREATIEVAVDQTQQVDVLVYDILGRQVGSVFSGFLTSGTSQPLKVSGDGMPAGTYIVRVSGETFAATRVVTLAR